MSERGTTTMTCKEVDAILDLKSDELSIKDIQHIGAHVMECDRCSRAHGFRLGKLVAESDDHIRLPRAREDA